MFSSLECQNGLNLKEPEAIWIEAEQLTQSIVIPSSEMRVNEADRWQLYLNELALCGFQIWLRKRAPSFFIDTSQCINKAKAVYSLYVNKFRLNFIVREHVLNEVIEIHREVIQQPNLAAHFYVLIEVIEELKCVILRGLFRHDKLMHYCNAINNSLNADHYRIPLSAFDPDPEHLLFYSEFLEPGSIPLPSFSMVHSETLTRKPENLIISQENYVQLSQWIHGVFTEGWYAINSLFGSDLNLDLFIRNSRESAKRGKLIDLGMELPGQSVVLLVNVTEFSDQELSVVVQLHPHREVKYLLSGIELVLLSSSEDRLQEVRSRSQDNYIQLKSFRGRSRTKFCIQVSLGSFQIREFFEL